MVNLPKNIPDRARVCQHIRSNTAKGIATVFSAKCDAGKVIKIDWAKYGFYSFYTERPDRNYCNGNHKTSAVLCASSTSISVRLRNFLFYLNKCIFLYWYNCSPPKLQILILWQKFCTWRKSDIRLRHMAQDS